MDLWNALQKHMGHNVKITFEGEKDNPENILLQCEDCHFDILLKGVSYHIHPGEKIVG